MNMKSEEKKIAEKIVYGALDFAKQRKNIENPLTLLEQAFKNIMPKQEVRSRRVGGANYQVPVFVKFDRAQALAVRWLTAAAKNKKGGTMAERLGNALIEASEEKGDAIKKKEDMHRMAEANKAFAHFKW